MRELDEIAALPEVVAPPASKFAIPELEALRARAQRITNATSNAAHDSALGRIAGRGARSKRLKDNPTRLKDTGLVEGQLRPMPKGLGVKQTSANEWLNLGLTDEGNDALDALLETGRRARQIIDDEIAVISDDVIRLRDQAKETVENLKAEFESIKLAQSQGQRDEIVRFWGEVADVLPEKQAQAVRELVGDQMFMGSGSSTTAQFDNALVVILRTQMKNEDLYQLFRRTVDADDVRQLDFQWGSNRTIGPGFLHPDNLRRSIFRRVGTDIYQADSDALYAIRLRHKEAVQALRDAEAEVVKSRIGVIERVLGENRDGFGTGDITPKFDKIAGAKDMAKKADIVEEMRDYSRRVPVEWIDEFGENHSFGFVGRGYYSLLDARVRVSGQMNQYGHQSWRSTLQHEFTHGHQYHTPQINAAERMYLSRRAQSAEDAVEAFTPRKYGSDSQPRFELGLGDDYMTKLYSDTSELSTRASEFLWMGRVSDKSTVDEEVLDWWLGVLLTM